MGRTVNEITKSERFNIRITKEDRERLESAHKMYRPRMQFQEFLLECMDYGLEIQEIEYKKRRETVESKIGSGFQVNPGAKVV